MVPRWTWCTCSSATVSLPTGDIIVLTVSGELDLGTVDLLDTALTCLLDCEPDHLIVDLADVRFCGIRGLRLLVAAEKVADENGICFAVSAASLHLTRIWSRLWPIEELPVRFPTTAAALSAARTDQAGSWGPSPWWDRPRYHRERPTQTTDGALTL